MKILYVIPELHSGGAERQMLTVASALQARGHAVRVVALRPSRRPFGMPDGLEIVTLRCGHSCGIIAFAAVLRHMIAFRPDVVQSFLFGFDFATNVAARLLRVPLVISSRRQLATWRQRRHLFLQHLANRLVDAVVANSLAASDYCASTEQGIDRGSIYTIPNAWVPRATTPDDTALPPKSDVTILCVANFWKGKGHGDLIAAVSAFGDALPAWTLWLVGEGSEEAAARQQARTLGVADRVAFLGRREDIDHLMQQADVYVHASEMESCPNAVLEAMANGLPVVAYACGGVTELLDGGELGRLVQPGNVAALADAVTRVSSDRATTRAVADRAKQAVADRYGSARIGETYELLFQALLARKGRAAPVSAQRRTVAFYTIGDATTPSTRFRMLQFIPHLQAAGLSVKLFALPRPRGCRYRRALTLLLHATMRSAQLRRHRRYEAIVIQKGLTLCRWRGAMAVLRGAGRPFVMDIDDAVLNPMPVVFPAPFRRRQNDDEPLRLMEMCTHLITGNEHLRETSAPYASSVSTIPTVIDCRRYGLIHSHTSGDDGDARCVVWCGQSSTLPYLIDALDPIREAADRLAPLTFRLRVICDDVSALESEDLGPVTLEGIRWSELREVQDLLGAHVGIMPLPDDEWTRGKCGFKLLQYMALGIPAIASPVGVNATIVTDRVNGCLAATDEEWVEALVRLLSDKALRMALGCKARETVRERFSLQQYAADFVRIVSGGAP